jgi:hypothetical protein
MNAKNENAGKGQEAVEKATKAVDLATTSEAIKSMDDNALTALIDDARNYRDYLKIEKKTDEANKANAILSSALNEFAYRKAQTAYATVVGAAFSDDAIVKLAFGLVANMFGKSFPKASEREENATAIGTSRQAAYRLKDICNSVFGIAEQIVSSVPDCLTSAAHAKGVDGRKLPVIDATLHLFKSTGKVSAENKNNLKGSVVVR